MIKGKFYTGLTSEMMNRSRAVNRQETHFFWPDETDSKPVTRNAKRTATKPSTPVYTNNNNTDNTQSDFSTKDLVRKQLSSGIQFYDNVNAKTPEARRRRFKKIDNINLNNNNDADFQPEKKKLETFSSKIEFYDFEPEYKSKIDKSVKAANVEKLPVKQANLTNSTRDEIKLKNDSPDVTKKRISFITDEKTVEKTKSILKNSDEKSPIEKVKPLHKRGLLPKNMSKSVENISKLAKKIESTETKPEKLSTIIKEVKQLNLTQEQSRKFDDYDEGDSYHRGSVRNESCRNHTDRDYGQRYPDRYESKGYRDDEYRHRNDDRGHNEPYRHNNRYDDYEDRGHGYDRSGRDNWNREEKYEDRHYERNQKDSYSQPRDNYEYKQRSRRYKESPVHESPIYDRDDYNRKYEPESRYNSRDNKLSPRKSVDSYYDEPSNRTNRHEEDEYSASINRKPRLEPQHLRSNFMSSGKVRQQAQRPMSVRNSAVTRVGVGLPDIE